MNKLIIMGRLAKEPEMRSTTSGVSVCSFTVAVDRSGTDATDFVDCVAWRNTAEFVSKYFHKGKMILTEGSLQSRKWTDKNGNNRISWENVVERVYFCGDKSGDAKQAEFTEITDEDGDLPF